MPRPRLFSPTTYLFRHGLSRGVFGDSKLWRVVGFAILARQLVRSVMQSEPEVVALERLKPGETMILRGVSAKSKRRR